MDIGQNLKTESVVDAGPAPVLSVPPEAPIREVIGVLQQHQVGSLLVCRDDVVVGIFTERDALRVMAAGGDLNARIESVMTPDPVTLRTTDTVAEAIRKMSAGGYRRLPVVDGGGRAVGVIKVSGIVNYLVQHFPTTVYNLPPVPDAVMEQREGS